MSARESGEHAARSRSQEPTQDDLPQAELRDEALNAQVDDLLDEIDDVLEENAEEFVRGFVQKGGQ